jgi:toxin ParE1/3/4
LKLKWSAFAVEDRDRIFEYLAERNPLAALEVDDRFDQSVERLLPHPQVGRPGRVEGTRELVVAGTPYIAAYRVSRDEIVILRLLHGAQEWPDRFTAEN